MPDSNKLVKSGETLRNPWGPAEPIYKGLLDAINQRFTGGQPDTSGLGITTAGDYNRLGGKDYLTQGSRLQNEYRGLLGPTNAETNLSDMASNPGVDPYAEQAFTAQRDKLANSINDRFSTIGRYGSGDYARNLGDSLGNATAGFMSDQWNAARRRQLAASGQIDNANLAQSGARRGILGDITNIQQGNFGNRMAALGGQTAAQGAEIAGRHGIEGLRWADLANGGGLLGSIYGPLAGEENFKQRQPLWERILGGVIGLGGMFGGLPLGGQPGMGQSNYTGWG